MIRILIHSEDAKLQHLLAPTLGPEFSIVVESRRDRVRGLISQQLCDVLILDFDENCGTLAHHLDFLDEVSVSPIPVVVMTNDSTRSTAMELVKRGISNQFRKPPVIPEFKIIVRRAHEHALLKRELEGARNELRNAGSCDGLIGFSAKSQVIYDLIRRVANLDAFVLITGESGTGKELVARAIHNLSARAKKPFVAVSCGAIPESLIEAELFGHEKGAFTGTVGTRMGYMEQAGDGTLFLDEIGELSLHSQMKLLRVLQQREFNRLGSSRLTPLRARVLFATHRDLAKMVAEGTFRQDLYYRVNVMRIATPSLMERTEDIPLLACHFLRQYSQNYQKQVLNIQPAAMAMLLQYEWPGNVRELENVIQNAIIMAESDTIRPEDLPESLQAFGCLSIVESSASGSFEKQLQAYRVKLVTAALGECNGNKTLAARSLSISRAYLHRLIREVAENVVAA
jgi:DNA-binding NtrC family response regulator